MAYIHKYFENGDKKLLKQIVILIFIALFLGFFMAGTSDDLRSEWLFILGAACFVTIVFLVISFRTNPLGWIKLTAKKKFEKIENSSEKINTVLETLDNRCFAFTWLIMEFFQIDHLVITPKGVFVIAAVEDGNFTIENEVLSNIEGSLEKQCTKLWRVCNMINILFKKGFNTHLMPVPVIASTEAEFVNINNFKGIYIMPSSELGSFISRKKDILDEKKAAGFARFVAERYIFR
jgi:hypothetical protein